MINLTIPQFNLLCEQYLAEDFDKVIAMVKEVKPQIDQIKMKYPQISKDQFEFMLINVVANYDDEPRGMSLEESDAFYDLLGQLYGVHDLAKKVDMRTDSVLSGEKEYWEKQKAMDSPGDWLRDYARAKGMPVHKPEPNPPRARSGFGGGVTLPDSGTGARPSGILEAHFEDVIDSSVRLANNMQKMNLTTIGDIINVDKDTMLGLPYFGRVTMKELTKKLNELVNNKWEQMGNPRPTTYEFEKIMSWIDSPMVPKPKNPPIYGRGGGIPAGGGSHGWPSMGRP